MTSPDIAVDRPVGRGWIIPFVVLAVAASLPLWVNQGFLFLAGLTILAAIFALSWNLLFGYAGLASFGHAGFFAIGAYFAGAAMRFDFGLPFLLVLICASALGGGVAFLIGLLALRRLAGIFLAVLTVALSEVLSRVISYIPALGAEDGFSNIPRPKISLGSLTLDLASSNAYYIFMLVVSTLVTLGAWWFVHSRFGRQLECVRQDPNRAAFMGINVGRYRLLAFIVSGAIASLSGAMFAPWTRIVTLDEAHWLASTQPILATLLGGVGSFWGPFVGSIGFMLINYSSRTLVGLSEVVVGGVLLVIIVASPTGVIGLLRLMAGYILVWVRKAPSSSGETDP